MGEIRTIPSKDEIDKILATIPAYMVPNPMPHAVVFEGGLSEDVCIKIQRLMRDELPYLAKQCDAVTREVPHPMSHIFYEIKNFALAMNDVYFHFDLREEDNRAWMQTYGQFNEYKIHTDAHIGGSRKLTAVAFLSDEDLFGGGDLFISTPPRDIVIPRVQGTIVVFPGWLPHYVTPVTSGHRKTINMGFWGPPFK